MAQAKKTTSKKPKAPVTPATSPATTPTNHKTVLIIVGVVTLVFVIIPGIIIIAGVLFVGKHLKDNDVNVNTDNGSVSIKDKNGNEFNAGGSQSLPKDFPTDVPVYKGDIISSGKLTTDGKTGWTVTIRTSDSLATVSGSLSKTFSSDGWTTSMNNNTNDGGLIIAQKGNVRANLFYNQEAGTTNILYTVTTEAEL